MDRVGKAMSVRAGTGSEYCASLRSPLFGEYCNETLGFGSDTERFRFGVDFLRRVTDRLPREGVPALRRRGGDFERRAILSSFN